MKLNLTKDVVIFDAETTGLSVSRDKIIQLAILKIHADGSPNIEKCRYINPEIRISEEATKIHGITNEMVEDAPTFKKIAKSILELIGDSDFITFNGNRFDIPMLMEEFARCGMELDMTNRKAVDGLRIFHQFERRTLKSAYKFYCNKVLENAHDAMVDVKATYEVVESQLDRYKGVDWENDKGEIVKEPVQNDVQKLFEFTKNPLELDFQGKVILNPEGVAVFSFGKLQGKPVGESLVADVKYHNWIINGDFTTDTKKVIDKLVMEYKEKNNK